MTRRLGALAVVLLVALPGVTAALGWTNDDYPLSSYPMFAHPRAGTTVLSGAVVVEVDGSERRLSPNMVSGTPEPLQATALIRSALDGDPEPLCRAITSRLGELAADERLLLVHDRVDSVAYYSEPGTELERLAEFDCTEAAR